MRREIAAVLFGIIILHTIYVALSYSEQPLAALGSLENPILIERVLMLLQFVPLIIVLSIRRLSKSMLLLFLSFAICINTIYTVSDFQTGFYAATVNFNSDIVPRMRASAHLMAYRDLGKLEILDYHAEYFLEFIVVHSISEVAGLNYILVYTFIIRALSITVWSLLFLWARDRLGGDKSVQQLSAFLLASSILIANSGYNFEVSFASVFLLMLYLLLTKGQRSYGLTICSLLVSSAIMFSSFRETILAAIICLLAVLVSQVIERIKPSSPLASKSSLILVLLILFVSRIFQFSSNYYVESYINQLVTLMNSVLAALRSELIPHREILVTVRGISNPVDQLISYTSVFSTVSILFLLVILSLRYLVFRKHKDSFSFSIPIVFLLALAIPVFSYAATIVTGVQIMGDFGSSTTLARVLTPLTVLTIVAHFAKEGNTRLRKIRFMKLIKPVGLICLSLSIMFSPFLFFRGEVKSYYDMVNFAGNNNDLLLTGTGLYYFVMNNTAESQIIRIWHNPQMVMPITSFFSLYFYLPLQYKLGMERVVVSSSPIRALSVDIYDNGIYTLTYYYLYSEPLVVNQSMRAR